MTASLMDSGRPSNRVNNPGLRPSVRGPEKHLDEKTPKPSESRAASPPTGPPLGGPNHFRYPLLC